MAVSLGTQQAPTQARCRKKPPGERVTPPWYGKSEWLSVNARPPEDTGGLQLIARGGYLPYLGFHVQQDGRLTPGRQTCQVIRDAVRLLPGGDFPGHLAAEFLGAVVSGHIFYYGGLASISRGDLRLLDQLSRQLLRRCCGLRRDHYNAQLCRPRWERGPFPASPLYAAAIVHLNLAQVAREWVEGSTDRLDMLRNDPCWPACRFVCPSVAPNLSFSSPATSLLWALRELGLLLEQADKPLPSAMPVAYPGEAQADLADASAYNHKMTCEGIEVYLSGLQPKKQRKKHPDAFPSNVAELQHSLNSVLGEYHAIPADPWGRSRAARQGKKEEGPHQGRATRLSPLALPSDTRARVRLPIRLLQQEGPTLRSPPAAELATDYEGRPHRSP